MPKRARAEPVETYNSDGGFVSDDDGAVRKVTPLPISIPIPIQYDRPNPSHPSLSGIIQNQF